MNQITPRNRDTGADDSGWRLESLSALSSRLLELCSKAGADQAEVSCSEERGLNVGVRMGEVETVEATRDRGIAVTVYFGQCKGSASTADLREDSLAATVEQACAIARFTSPDPAAGLADAARMATHPLELDTWHPWELDADRAVELALACEHPRLAMHRGAKHAKGEYFGPFPNGYAVRG